MSWITILWCVGGSAAASLGFIYLVNGLHERKSLGSLLFSIIAISVAGIASTEVGMMHSATPEEFGFWVRWFHIPAFFMITATVLFVRAYFETGRIWLAWLIVGLRCIVLVGDFALPAKFIYCKIVTLERVPFLGEMVAAPGRVLLNPWRWLPTISVLLFGAFVVDAAISHVQQRAIVTAHAICVRRSRIIGLSILRSTLAARPVVRRFRVFGHQQSKQ